MTNFVQELSIDWNKIDSESYLRKIPAISNLITMKFERSVTFLVGENGSGKSTLLEAMAVAAGFNPEGGTKNYLFATYNSHSELHAAMKLVRSCYQPDYGYFLRAESFYNVATQEREYADAEHPSEKYHEKSHGESFLAVAQKYFRPRGLYFLDEPEAALSPPDILLSADAESPGYRHAASAPEVLEQDIFQPCKPYLPAKDVRSMPYEPEFDEFCQSLGGTLER